MGPEKTKKLQILVVKPFPGTLPTRNKAENRGFQT